MAQITIAAGNVGNQSGNIALRLPVRTGNPTARLNCNGAEITPAQSQSSMEESYFASRVLCPLSDTFRHAIHNQQMIVSLISVLMLLRSPFAVIGRIIAVIVEPFNAVLACRGIAHVSVEVFKKLFPTVTDFNPTTAVMLVFRERLALASGFHVQPSHVNRSLGQSVRFCSRRHGLAMPAPATLGFSVAKEGGKHQTSFSALTPTQPLGSVMLVTADVTQNGQTAKSLSGYISKTANNRMWLKLNVIIRDGHLVFTSLVKYQLARLGESVSALRRAVSILSQVMQMWGGTTQIWQA